MLKIKLYKTQLQPSTLIDQLDVWNVLKFSMWRMSKTVSN